LSVKEYKFAEMSTWQQELYVQVQVRVQVLQNCIRVQVQVPSTASEAITISTTNCRRLKFLQSVIMKPMAKTRTLYT